jgi:hypothetical protein
VPCSKSICLLKVSPLPSRRTYQPLSSTVKENVPFRGGPSFAHCAKGGELRARQTSGWLRPNNREASDPILPQVPAPEARQRLARPVRAGKSNQGKSPRHQKCDTSSPRHRNRPPLSGPTRPILLQNSYTGDCPARFIESAPHAVSISRRAALPIRRKSLAKSRI